MHCYENTGTIVDVKNKLTNGVSTSEIHIRQESGNVVSTGLHPSSIIKPYFWKVGDGILFEIDDNEVINIKKTHIAINDHRGNSETVVERSEMPETVKWFERLFVGSIVLGLFFGQVPMNIGNPEMMFAFVIAVINVAIVWWASRGRSNVARWLIGIITLVSVILLLPSASILLYMGPEGVLLALQTVLQIVSVSLAFSPSSRSWFERETRSS